MKKKIIFTVSMLVLFGITFSAYSEEYDFRKIRWGMSREEVEKTETMQPVVDTEKTLAYDDYILNKSVAVSYIFKKNVLVGGDYNLLEKHINKNLYIEDYKDFKKALADKYGKPEVDKTIWSNSLYKSDPEMWGIAVSHEDVKFICRWKTERTLITMVLSGINNRCVLHIWYDSTKYLDMFMDEEKKKDEDKL